MVTTAFRLFHFHLALITQISPIYYISLSTLSFQSPKHDFATVISYLYSYRLGSIHFYYCLRQYGCIDNLMPINRRCSIFLPRAILQQHWAILSNLDHFCDHFHHWNPSRCCMDDKGAVIYPSSDSCSGGARFRLRRLNEPDKYFGDPIADAIRWLNMDDFWL